MKIAIAATTQALDAQVSKHAARAPYYLLLDTERDLYEVSANPVARIERGAAPKAAAFLIQQNVDRVVAGEFGYRFRADLEENGISCEERTGAVVEVIAGYRT